MTATLPSVSSVKSVVPNPAWAKLPIFDRTGWKRMAFGEFAESFGERAEPKDAQQRNTHMGKQIIFKGIPFPHGFVIMGEIIKTPQVHPPVPTGLARSPRLTEKSLCL